MNGFTFTDWRRELEQAIARAEPIPIRVLLDEMERQYTDIEAAFNDCLNGDIY